MPVSPPGLARPLGFSPLQFHTEPLPEAVTSCSSQGGLRSKAKRPAGELSSIRSLSKAFRFYLLDAQGSNSTQSLPKTLGKQAKSHPPVTPASDEAHPGTPISLLQAPCDALSHSA